MSKAPAHLRSNLGRVRGLGSAHEGVKHWWFQRVTAIALLPLTFWLIYALATQLLAADRVDVAAWLESPLTAAALVAFLALSAWHAKLGLQVVVEDYVHTEWKKLALLLFVTACAFTITLLGAFAVLKLHTTGV